MYIGREKDTFINMYAAKNKNLVNNKLPMIHDR